MWLRQNLSPNSRATQGSEKPKLRKKTREVPEEASLDGYHVAVIRDLLAEPNFLPLAYAPPM
jgi:hypothetical protein